MLMHGRWDDGSDAPYYNTVYSTRGVFSMIPTGMRFLTQLHTLHLSTGEIEDIYGVASLCGISQMIPLADLSMSFGKRDEYQYCLAQASGFARAVHMQLYYETWPSYSWSAETGQAAANFN